MEAKARSHKWKAQQSYSTGLHNTSRDQSNPKINQLVLDIFHGTPSNASVYQNMQKIRESVPHKIGLLCNTKPVAYFWRKKQQIISNGSNLQIKGSDLGQDKNVLKRNCENALSLPDNLITPHV